MTTLAARVAHLESLWPAPVGCDVCRTWTAHDVVICDDAGEDRCSRPAVYPACGRAVPWAEVRVFVGIPEATP